MVDLLRDLFLYGAVFVGGAFATYAALRRITGGS